MSGAYISWTPDGGELQALTFDAVVSQQISRTAIITEHPVEEGANIADHYRLQVDSASLEVYVSNAPITGDGLSSTSLDVPTYVLPEIAGVTLDVAKPSLIAGGPFSTLSNLARAGLDAIAGSDTTVAQVHKGTAAIGTEMINVQTQGFAGIHDYVADTQAVLERLRANAQLVSCIWASDSVANALIESVEISQSADDGDGATLKISLRAVRIVQTRLVAAPKPSVVRAKPKNALGKKDPEPAPAAKKSVAKILQDAIVNFTGLGK